MATRTWVGKAQAVPQVSTATVSSATVGQARSMIIDKQLVTYTVVTGDTTSTVAAALILAYAANVSGQWRSLQSVVQDTTTPAQINITGPTDGEPFTLTVSSGMATATVTTPTGPNHADAADNWDGGGALPIAADNIIFDRGEAFEGPKYGLANFAAVAFASVRRLAGYRGVWGLPPVNRAGFYEYKTRYFSLSCISITIETTSTDASNQLCFVQTSASAAVLRITGDGNSSPDVVDCYGMASTSSVLTSGGSVSVAGFTGQTAVLASVNATNSVVRLGAGITLTAAILDSCGGRISCSFATLDMDRNSNVIVDTSAACTTAAPTTGVKNNSGTLTWQSVGALPVIELGSDATLNGTLSPGFAVTSVKMYERSTLNDPAGRITAPYDVYTVNCTPADVTINTPVNRKLTVTTF